MNQIILLSLIALTVVNAATDCTNASYNGGRCCPSSATAATANAAAGVKTCPSSGMTADTLVDPTACKETYQLVSGTGCVACAATEYTASDTATTCTACSHANQCCVSKADFSTIKNSATSVKTCATVTSGALGSAVLATACNAGYKLVSGVCTQCAAGEYTASDTATTCTACANQKCCISDAAFATVKSTGVTTCATVTSGAIGTAVDATVCDTANGYALSSGVCSRAACRATATEAEYRADGGKKCCFSTAAFKSAGVTTCATAPTVAGTEYNATVCQTGYTLNATTGECIQNICRASQTQDAYRAEGGKQCCYVGSAFILGNNVATCPATGTANTEAAAATCADGYEIIDGACIQKKCRTAQTEAAYQTEGGMKCCWLSATSTLKALGVATCGTAPTAIGEYEALTCSAGYFLSAGTCKALCAATTVQADYTANGQKCCFATTTLNGLKGAGVATCATAPTVVGEYAAATCAAGYFLVSGVCEKICSAATADAAAYATNGGNKCCSKDATNTFKGKGVNTCTAGNFTTTMEWNAVGCDANHYLSAGACMACAADKFSAVNSTTADACQAKDKAPAGTIYDEATQSFLRCTAPCATCVGAPNKCASCVVNVPDFKAPAEADANYETLLKTYQFDNATATCLSSCAEGFKVADLNTRAACVESSTTGVFAIVLSIFSLLITLL